MQPRLNILFSAFFCSPFQGSEAASGWQIATRLAKHHDVTLLCGDLKNAQPTKTDLDKYQAQHGLPDGLTILHVPGSPLVKKIHTLHWKLPFGAPLYYQAYRLWQKQAFQVARELHARKPFDAIHHFNLSGFREPGYLWKLDSPFFWGPIGGANSVPAAFLEGFGTKAKIQNHLKRMANQWQKTHPGRARKAAAAASQIWAVSDEEKDMVNRWGYQTTPMQDAGCDVIPATPKTFTGRLRLCWSGHFFHRKALPILLHALTKSHDVTVEILGDGQNESTWKELAGTLNVGSKINWHGRVPHAEAKTILADSHALVHTSLQEGTSHVIMEALGAGVPVICHDTCGMHHTINESCGIKIPLVDPKTSIDGFAKAIQTLQNPEIRATLSQGAYHRAQIFDWDRLAGEISEAYVKASA